MGVDKRRGQRRAPDKTQTSISLRRATLERAREAAAKDGRTFSNWLEQMLRAKFEEEDSRSAEAEADKDDLSGKPDRGAGYARDISTEHLPGDRPNGSASHARN